MHFTGPSSAPTDLNITSCNESTTLLVWGPPPDVQSPSLLSYAVVIRNGSGAPVYSETVREPQLVITTPDLCGNYDATVTPMCGSITGAQTSPVELESKFKETAWVFYAMYNINALSFIHCENSIRIFEQFCLVIYVFESLKLQCIHSDYNL